MIQRQQSLWLILSIFSGILSYALPFYSGTKLVQEKVVPGNLRADSSFFLMVVVGIAILLAGVALFSYKDRKLQFKLCVFGILTSALVILLFFVEVSHYQSGSLSLSAIFTFAILIGFVMAARGVLKDEKLVKSLDKLR